jgi:hypothetical protein
MRIAIFTVGVVTLLIPLSVQAMSVTREVVCYHFQGSELKRRDICKLQDFDTSSRLTWSDGVETQIRWVSRYSDTPNLDGAPAREYKRDPETLQILERPIAGRAVQCLQALESNNSVCWSR